jgi:hypothetical protein
MVSQQHGCGEDNRVMVSVENTRVFTPTGYVLEYTRDQPSHEQNLEANGESIIIYRLLSLI